LPQVASSPLVHGGVAASGALSEARHRGEQRNRRDGSRSSTVRRDGVSIMPDLVNPYVSNSSIIPAITDSPPSRFGSLASEHRMALTV